MKLRIKSAIAIALMATVGISGCGAGGTSSLVDSSGTTTDPSSSATTSVSVSDSVSNSEDSASSLVPPTLEEFAVTFYVDDTVYHSVKVLDHYQVSPPEDDPELANHTFIGWFTAEELAKTDGTAFDFATLIDADLDLYAAFSEDEYIDVLFQ